jgi:hypothetical protein
VPAARGDLPQRSIPSHATTSTLLRKKAVWLLIRLDFLSLITTAACRPKIGQRVQNVPSRDIQPGLIA